MGFFRVLHNLIKFVVTALCLGVLFIDQIAVGNGLETISSDFRQDYEIDPWVKIRNLELGNQFDRFPPDKKFDWVIWGHYCGWGNESDDYSLPPTDPIDALCMEHDKCYDRRGHFDCECDEPLARDARELYEIYRREGPEDFARMSRWIWLTFKWNTCKAQ